MHIWMFLLVLALSCFSVQSYKKEKYCDTESDCYPRDRYGNIIRNNWWQCCNRICHRWIFGSQERCPCYLEYKCPPGETCGSNRQCKPYRPTRPPKVTTRRYTKKKWTPWTVDKSCTSDSDCTDFEECFESEETNGPLCVPKSQEEWKRTLVNIGLPIGLPLLVLPLVIYCSIKAYTWQENRWLRGYGSGRSHSTPARLPPQNTRARTTQQPTTSRATELQSVSAASPRDDRTVIEVESPPPTAPQLSTASSQSSYNDHTMNEAVRQLPSAPQLLLPQNPPTDEALEPRGADQQAGIAVSSSAGVTGHSSSSLLPDAPPSYNEIRRLQSGEVVEQPPPSYQEAVKEILI